MGVITEIKYSILMTSEDSTDTVMGANTAPADIIMGAHGSQKATVLVTNRSSETMKGLMVRKALMRPRYYAGAHEDNTLY